MSINDLLYVRRTEHEALLQHVVELLQKDERVVAAWLFGSRGRHTRTALGINEMPLNAAVQLSVLAEVTD